MVQDRDGGVDIFESRGYTVFVTGKCLVRTAPGTSSPSTTTASSSDLSSCTSVRAITTIGSISVGISIATISSVHGIGVAVSSISTSESSPHASSVVVLGCNSLNVDLVSVDCRGSFLNKCFGYLLLFECDKCKVLGSIVVALVYRSDHLDDGTEGGKVSLDLLCC